MEELVLSANQLCSVPGGVSRLSRLRVLKVHSNPLKSLPRLAHLSALKVNVVLIHFSAAIRLVVTGSLYNKRAIDNNLY